jgi:hypothetical protein
MLQKQNIRIQLLIGLFLVSLGGWFLHLRVHPPFQMLTNIIPFTAGLISIVAIPAMFFSKKTLAYAYVLNGMLVIIGTITMTHYSIFSWPEHATPATIFVGTLMCDIFILMSNFFIGKALFELELFKTIDAPMRHGRFWRYPNMGWWGVHSIALSGVYVLGHLLWT